MGKKMTGGRRDKGEKGPKGRKGPKGSNTDGHGAGVAGEAGEAGEEITTAEAGRRLGVSAEWVRQLAAGGRVRARLEGTGNRGTWLVDAGDVAWHARTRRGRGRPRK